MPSSVKLEPENHSHDAAFNKELHGESSANRPGIRAMLFKGTKARKTASEGYFKHWRSRKSADEVKSPEETARIAAAVRTTKLYYDLATDLFEHFWGQSFHTAPFARGESFGQSIARQEHYLAHVTGIFDGMKVLDVGCGVGGPAREIAKFTGADITGLNNNDYQIERATKYTAKADLSDKVQYVKGDFMQMSFKDNTFDAVYAFEATCHASSLEGVYSEIFRVLKPGGVFGVHEWVMTDKYDHENPRHRELRHGIAQGYSIADLRKASDAVQAMKNAGFEMERVEDLANGDVEYPWYWPFTSKLRYVQSLNDLRLLISMSQWGYKIASGLFGLMEMVHIAPTSTKKMVDSIAYSCDSMVEAAREGLFTPMFIMVGRKPMSSVSPEDEKQDV